MFSAIRSLCWSRSAQTPQALRSLRTAKLLREFESVKLSGQDLTGRLILGTSPVTADGWSGQLRALALYDRALTADDVSQHLADWTHGEPPHPSWRQGTVAIYAFNEGSGNVVHNFVDSKTDLLIPERFSLLQAQFLERPWDEFRPDVNYWKDVGVNVAGFIPLGFFFYAYFCLLRRFDHPVAITVAFGFAVSLTIEVLQSFLPTRNSGMTDLITNTLGTGIGVLAFRHRAIPALMAAMGLRLHPQAENCLPNSRT